MTKKIRIISLGEIVTLDISKTIQAFIALIASKKENANHTEIMQQIGGVLRSNNQLIEEFKLGKISEESFIEQLISAIENATTIKITTKEFLDAWKAMHPTFSQFNATLQEAFTYHAGDDQEVIFISATNTIDLRYIADQLEENNILYSTRNGIISSINGIKLHSTCEAKIPKAELIASVIHQANNPPESALASSMSSILTTKKAEAPNIKYVYSLNRINDPILADLKDTLDQTNTAIEEKTETLSVEMVLWRKLEKQSLTEALQSTAPSKFLLVAKL